jgi:glycosyltransferase involved in cell wall biosynthesis
MKKKILWVGEAPYLNTGYAVYAKNILGYLASLSKYEIVQLGIYAKKSDPEINNFPWIIVPNCPEENTPEHAQYKENELSQFGSYKFEDVCSEFKPDIVCNIADVWMFEFIFRSPYLKQFKTILMPTCDSEPQPKQWLDVYAKSDKIFTYCDWAKDELIDCMGPEHRDKIVGSASPVAADCYYPRSKVQLRSQMGIGTHETIFGTVMRNQKRKLYPQLFESFRKYLDMGGDGKLFCHTSYPDKGWDFQMLLKRYNLSNNVWFTYKCVNCNKYSLDTFTSLIKECKNCQSITSKMCTVDDGVEAEDLANIYNIMDFYIQPCTNEGFGMPIVEAAACGVPVCTTNYSAPKDIVEKLGGTPIKHSFSIEPETGLKKAIIDTDHLARIMLDVYNTPKEIINIKRIKTRELFEKFYSSWKRTGQKWENVIDSLDYGSWDSLEDIKEPNINIPEELNSGFDISSWIIENTLCDPNQLYTFMHARLIRDLSLGFVRKTIGGEYDHELSSMQMFNSKLSVEELITVFANKRIRINNCERRRCSVSKNS